MIDRYSPTDAPVCVSGQKTRYGTALFEEVRATCRVDANPPEVTFKWQLSNSIKKADIPYSQVSSPRGLIFKGETSAYQSGTEIFAWEASDVSETTFLLELIDCRMHAQNGQPTLLCASYFHISVSFFYSG